MRCAEPVRRCEELREGDTAGSGMVHRMACGGVRAGTT